MGKRSGRNRKRRGRASANLRESIKPEEVSRNVDVKDVDDNLEKLTIEGLLEENKELKETVDGLRKDIRMFQEKQITFLELSEALEVAVKELCIRTGRIEGEGGEVIDRAAFEPVEFALLKGELAELSRENQELKLTVEEPKKSVDPIKDVPEKIEVETREMKKSCDPFVVFPKEVWEQILGELEDSKDILQVFKAFPDLEGQVLKNKYWWLFDQVVPHLHPWINMELRSCRLVCKKWAHGVDRYLENLPKVVDHDRLITGQVWHWKWASRGFGVSFKWTKAEKLTEFLRDIERLPPATNPFLGRSVTFDMDIRSHAFVNVVKEMLRKHGHHVWFLNLSYSGANLSQLLKDVMAFVPNLKSLGLNWGSGPYSNLQRFQEDQRELFPRLPQLESLELRINSNDEYGVIPRNFMDFFVICYSRQIKRLSIPQSQWRREYCTLFPRLREFHLLNINVQDGKLVELLTSLDTPDLDELSLSQNYPEILGSSSVNLVDILSFLKPFPKLRDFGLHMHGEVKFDHDAELPIDRFPSIKSIRIKWNNIQWLIPEFLSYFPSLEYANISDYQSGLAMFVMFWGEYNQVYHWDQWEELPALKEIHVDSDECYKHIPEHYTRTKYEWLKKQRKRKARRRSLSDDELLEGFIGFESMLSGTWGEVEDTYGHGDGHH